MERGTVDNAMPNSGERSDIGPLPDWAARYIMTQDYRDLQVLLGNGRVSGSVPWHFVDGNTGNYLSIKDRPKVWLDARGTSSSFGADALPAGAFDYKTGWVPDLAHQPSLNFVPYLVTGDRYFADELSAQANWSLANQWTTHRQKSPSQDLVFFGEVRAFGWTMRTLGEAAYILPDTSPLKVHLENVVNNNLQWVISTYLNGPDLTKVRHEECLKDYLMILGTIRGRQIFMELLTLDERLCRCCDGYPCGARL